MRDLGDTAGIRELLDEHDDAALAGLMTNLAGHDIDSVLAGLGEAAQDERPACLIAYTIKGFGLPFAGHKDNHAGMMTPEQMAELRDGMGIAAGDEWEPFAGLDLPAGALDEFLAAVPFNQPAERSFQAPRVAVPPELAPPPAARQSTQEGFGRLLADIARSHPALADRIITTSPDVTVSTNLGGWVNRRGVYAQSRHSDAFRQERTLSAQDWTMGPQGQHLELGIAENNLFILLAAFGLTGPLFGARLLPVGTLYDPFIRRGLDALNYACYQDARFLMVATPSGLSLAPEGGAHQSVLTPLIGIGQPGLTMFEPAYVDELAEILRWSFEHMQADDGGAVYLRLSTRPLDQAERVLTPRLRAEIIAGGYWLSPPADGAELAVVASGAVLPEALEAHGQIAEDIPGAGLLVVTSASRLHDEWLGSVRGEHRRRTAAHHGVAAAAGAGRRPGHGARRPSGHALVAGLGWAAPRDAAGRGPLRTVGRHPRSVSHLRPRRGRHSRRGRAAGRAAPRVRFRHMATELRLPPLADTVTSVKLAVWLKAEGEAVAAGEPLVEVETDKTNVEIEAPAGGVLREIHVAAGTEGLETGALLATIEEDAGADIGAAAGDAAEESAAADTAAEPEAPPSTVTLASSGTAPASGAAGAAQAAATAATDGLAPAASPLARRMAAAAGLDLGEIKGTGRNGRIGKADVERALAARTPAAAAPAALHAPPAAPPAEPAGDTPAAGFREQPLSAMRRVTAERLQAAKQTVPHFYLNADCAMDAALRLRAELNEREPALGLTLTDLIVRAAAQALREVPAANSSWADGVVRLYDAVDIAVAVDTPAGLVTPIIRAADRKGLREISGELKALGARARSGALKPEEYSGGTFTISNLGMYGVDSLYAIVNPPQSCILGVGAARRRPVAAADGVEVATIAACTLSADHRAIDGATGARLLAAFRTVIEQPALLALEL